MVDWSKFTPVDEPPAAPAAPVPPPVDWSQFTPVDAPPAQQPSIAADVAKSLPSGIVRGAAETAMMPQTIERTGGGVADWLLHKADSAVRSLTGGTPMDDAQWQKFTADRNAAVDPVVKAADPATYLSPGQDIVRTIMDSNLHAPQTTAGRYADTIGQFIPGAMAGGTNSVKQALGDIIVPAVTSQAAGDLAQGTPYEGAARMVGALAGNIGTGLARGRATAPQRSIANAAGDISPQEFDAAQQLQQRAQGLGLPLTGPEAIQSATSGGTKLADLMRVVENSPRGGVAATRFFSQRPEQVRAAVGNTLDTIATQDPNPATLGPRAAEIAGNAIDAERQAINQQTRPLYQAAEPQTVPDPAFSPKTADPAYALSLKRLREDPVLGPKYKAMPDNSVAVIDAVTKDMEAQGKSLANSSVQGFQPEKAAIFSGGAAGARGIAKDAVPDYEAALQQQADLRTAHLDPLNQGTLGQVAKAATTPDAYNAVLPPKPLVGGEKELADTIARILSEPGGKATAGPLVRQGLADRFDQASKRLVGGDNQYAGALYAKGISGTDQQGKDLAAVVGALPTGPAAAPAVNDMVDILRATGMRKPAGSMTTFNSMIEKDLGELPIGAMLKGGARSLGTSLVTNMNDNARRMYLGKHVATLADLFTSPESVKAIQDIVQRGASHPLAEGIQRALIQGLPQGSR